MPGSATKGSQFKVFLGSKSTGRETGPWDPQDLNPDQAVRRLFRTWNLEELNPDQTVRRILRSSYLCDLLFLFEYFFTDVLSRFPC